MQDDLPARIRAARAYAKLGVRECAHALGISEDTFERTEKGKRPLTIPEAKAYADATGVPLWFLLDGWPGSLRQIDERLNELQRLLAGELGDLVGQIIRALGLVEPPATAPPRQEPPAAPPGEDPPRVP